MKLFSTKRYRVLAGLLLVLFATATIQPAFAVVGGQDAKLGEFPFLVALVNTNDGSQFCGGSIINEDWVLTAAHCFFTAETPPVQDTFEKDVQIKAGIIDLNDSSAQAVGVTKIYLLGYDGDIHDIALLHLAKPLKLDNKTVEAVKLNADLQFPDLTAKVMVAGWGATDPDGQTSSDTLKKTTLPVISCESDVATEYVCAGDKKGHDTCQGDSGGPLVVQQIADPTATVDPADLVPGIHALQIGIVSFGGDKCGQRGAYTRVATYIDWINKTIADDSNK
ncbi:MAG: serine protease [Chloroflexota bacterium]